MSNIDKRALREAAEKATPGVLVYLPKNTSIEYDYGSDESQGSVTYMDSGDFTQKQTDLNGAFIAAANPSTVLALLDELEAKDKQIAELEDIAKSVKFDPIPMEDLGNKSDGKKHPYMFGAGYNSAVVHCESLLLRAFSAAAGKGAK